jgi:hypothetical protein
MAASASEIDQKKETLRTQFFQESFQLGQKPRHGMFSVPISNAIGDNTYFKPKPARKGEDGAVITDPRNFTTKKVRKGHTDDVLFSKPSYVAVGDPFKPPQAVPMRTTKKDGFKEAGHEMNFKPAKTVQRKVKADFEHKTDFVEVKKKIKNEDGSVPTEPRNFLTNPPKKGEVGKGTTFSGVIEHIPDPFNRRKELEHKELVEH